MKAPRLPLFLALLGALLGAVPAPAPAADEAALRQHLQQLERAGQYAAAIPLYQELRRSAPQDSGLVHGLARALSATEAHGQVVALLESWLRDHPGDIQAYLHLGQAYHRLGQNERSLKTWRQTLKRAPAQLPLYLKISDQCRAAGLHREAIQTLLDGRKALEQPHLFTWQLASLYLLIGDYRLAIEAYLEDLRQNEQRLPAVEASLLPIARDPTRGPQLVQALEHVLAVEPDPLRAAHLLSGCALETGDPQTGYRALAPLVELAEGPELLFQFASRCQARGYDLIAVRAYALFAAHAQDSPYLYQALLRQAEIQVRQKDYPPAVETYTRLAQQFPDRPETLEALFNLGRLQLEVLGDVPRARTALQTVLQSTQRGSWTSASLDLLAECALREDDLEQARAHLRRRGRLDPSSGQLVRFRLAELAYFQGDFDQAAEFLQAVLDHDPRHERANDALELLLLLEQFQPQAEALQRLARAQLRERQQRPRAAAGHWDWLEKHASPPLRQLSLLARARVLEERQKPAAALALYENLVENFPPDPYTLQAQLGRARLYEQQGRVDRALQTYESVLLSFPDDVRAPEIRLRIQRLRHLEQERKKG